MHARQSLAGGRFELGERVARGGAGVVHRGLDRATGGPVAIKVIAGASAEEAARLAREAAILGSVSHPHVVRYIAHGTTGDRQLYLVTEWLDGFTLSHELRNRGLTAAGAVHMMCALAGGLAQVHALGVIHRDLKPDNLILAGGDPGTAKILDFGIALSRGARRLTRRGLAVGTPGYMAPEQAAGARILDARADVFALGCILYECLTGRYAFAAPGERLVRACVLFSRPAPVRSLLPGVPPALDLLVDHMLARDPADRLPGAAALQDALRALPALDDRRRAPVARSWREASTRSWVGQRSP